MLSQHRRIQHGNETESGRVQQLWAGWHRSCFFRALRAMARSSSKRGSLYADLERLRMHFSSLDPDNTGYIGYQELTALARSESGMDESMVPELLERLDRDKDGKVSLRMRIIINASDRSTTYSASQIRIHHFFCR